MAYDDVHFAFALAASALAVTEDTAHLGRLEQPAAVTTPLQRWLSTCWR